MNGTVQDFSPWIGLAALLLVLAACALTAYSVRQKQLRFLPLGVAAALVCYLLLQGIVLRNYEWARSPAALAWTEYVYTLPLWQPILLLSGISALLLAAFVRVVRQERQLITPMSVKAATDSLPAGLCFYLPGGRIVLVNETMQRLCQMICHGSAGGKDQRSGHAEMRKHHFAEAFIQGLFSVRYPHTDITQ